MKLSLLLFIASGFIVGCSSYRGPAWVMQVNSSPTVAHIYSGKQPTEYLGTTPCYVSVQAEAGGGHWGRMTLWAVPATNTPGLYRTSITLGTLDTYTKLPPALFFDLTKSLSASK